MPTFAFSTANTRVTMRVIPTPQELRPAPGMFVMEYEYTGMRCFGRLTGRTRRFNGHDCPTIERIAIETVVDVLPGMVAAHHGVGVPGGQDESFALWGDPGAKLAGGTYAVYPHKVVNGEVVA